MSEIDNRLLDTYQRDFPLEPRPFARMAAELGISEEEVLDRLINLRDAGKISRLGAIVRPNAIGSSTLAALRVAEHTLGEVAALVCAHPEINHCYLREHDLNLWFVVTAADRNAVDRLLRTIEEETGLVCLDLPMLEAYHIDLGFALHER